MSAVGALPGDRGANARHPRQAKGGWSQKLRLWTLIAFLMVCALTGGASRPEVPGLIILRPLAFVALAILLVSPGAWQIRSLRVPFLLLAAFAATIAVQLVPLPPEWWRALPGRELFAEITTAAGIEEVWRPISLTPDLTFNSLLTLLPVLVVMVGQASLTTENRQALLYLILALALASALLGLLQLVGSFPALYQVSHKRSAVGFFANRNHHATFLALCFPLLRMWTLLPARNAEYARFRLFAAGAIALFLVPYLLVAGSRNGLALALVSIVATAFIALPTSGLKARLSRHAHLAIAAAVVAIPAALVSLTIFSGRASSIERLFLLRELDSEARFVNAPVTWGMVGEFFPFGAGFGSFDAVFRVFEAEVALDPTYFNHAHSDPVELAITGGLPAIAVLAAFLLWFAHRTLTAFRAKRGPSSATIMNRTGAIIIMVLLVSSLLEYPLRTPLLAAVFAIAVSWLADRRST